MKAVSLFCSGFNYFLQPTMEENKRSIIDQTFNERYLKLPKESQPESIAIRRLSSYVRTIRCLVRIAFDLCVLDS